MPRRTIYPVGQGGFYSEKFFLSGGGAFTVVYDCGSINVSSLEREIDNSGIRNINLLVLSHFHKDHINGLKYLSAKGVTIQKVVMPQLTNAELVLYFFDNTDLEVYQDPTILFPNCSVVRVNAEETGNEEILAIQSLPNSISHHSKIMLGDRYEEWIFKFYVDKTVYGGGLNQDDASFLNGLKAEAIYEKSNKARITKIYKSLSTDLNLTSMCMYSGPKEPFYWSRDISGNLLTGDILLDDERSINDFTSHFHEVAGNIGCLQIPHHGSHYNMSRVISEFNLKRSVIQAGSMNQYGHPAYQIVQMHTRAGLETHVITERDSQLHL